MSIILLLITTLTIAIVLFWVFDDSKILRYIVIAIISGFIITGIRTNRTCADGWNSPSIGTQGACSHHGGVVTEMNDFGWTALTASTGILIIVFFTTKKNGQ